jgi:hypothetical protein
MSKYKKIVDLEPGEVFEMDGEYFIKTHGGYQFSLTHNDTRYYNQTTNVEVVKGVIKITHARDEEGE